MPMARIHYDRYINVTFTVLINLVEYAIIFKANFRCKYINNLIDTFVSSLMFFSIDHINTLLENVLTSVQK